MKNFMASIINAINNNKLFYLGLAIAAITLGVLSWLINGATASKASAAAVVFAAMILGIRFFLTCCLPQIRKEQDAWWRTFLKFLIWGFIVFLHGPILAILKEFISDRFWYDIVNSVNLWIGYVAFGLIGFAFLIGLLYGISSLWQNLVKWANK